jgi:hypothetical protein
LLQNPGLRRRGSRGGAKRRVDDRNEIPIVSLCPGFQCGDKNGNGDRRMDGHYQIVLGLAVPSREGTREQVAGVIHRGFHLPSSQLGCTHHETNARKNSLAVCKQDCCQTGGQRGADRSDW